MPDAITFSWDKGRLRLIMLGAAFVGALGLIFILQDDMSARIFGVAWMSAVIALVAALLRRTKMPGPVVTIDARGIIDSRISEHVIPWDDIASIEALEAENLTFVGIDLTAEAVSRTQLRAMHRAMRWPNRILGFPSLSISMHALDGTSEDVIAAAARFRPELVRVL